MKLCLVNFFMLFTIFANAQVTIYSDCDYIGQQQVLKQKGRYNSTNLQLPNNVISSIKIENGYEVSIFDGEIFNGEKRTLTTSTTCLVNLDFNDRISSLIVNKNDENLSKIYNNNEVVVKDLTQDQYQQKFDEYKSKGYIPKKVWAYESLTNNSLLYNAVFLKNSNNIQFASYHGLDINQFEKYVYENSKSELTLTYVDIDNDNGQLRFCAVFSKIKNNIWEEKHMLSESEYTKYKSDRLVNGYKEYNYSKCKYNGKTVYATTWYKSKATTPDALIPTNKKNKDVDLKKLPSRNTLIINTNKSEECAALAYNADIQIGYAFFGDKNENGLLIKLNSVIIYDKKTDNWVMIEFKDYLPSKIVGSDNSIITISNYNFINSSVDLVLSKDNKVIKKQSNVKFENDLIAQFLYEGALLSLNDKNFNLKSAINNFQFLPIGMFPSSAADCNSFKNSVSEIGYYANLIGMASGFVGIAFATGPLGIFLAGVGAATASLSFANSFNQKYKTGLKSTTGWQTVQLDGIGAMISSLPPSGGIVGHGVWGVGAITTVLGAYADLIGASDCEGLSFLFGTGDPHLTTPDGLHYDFQGHGEFVAFKSSFDDFEMQIRQTDPKKYNLVTITTAIAIKYDNQKICVLSNPLRIIVNNKLLPKGFKFALTPSGGVFSVFSDAINLKTKKGDELIISRIDDKDKYGLDYKVLFSPTRKNKITGLFGNYDGNPDNDLILKSGAKVTAENLHTQFAEDWRVTSTSSLFYYDNGKNTESYTIRNFPTKKAIITDDTRKKAEIICRNAGVTSQPFLNDCIYDVAITGDKSFTSIYKDNQSNNGIIKVKDAFFSNSINEQVTSSDLIYHKIKLDFNTKQDDAKQKCFFNWYKGTTYSYEDGTKNAKDIDAAIINAGNEILLFIPSSLKACASSCGVSDFNSHSNIKNWTVINVGAIQQKWDKNDDDISHNKSNNAFISRNLWNDIKSKQQLIDIYNINPLKVEKNYSWSNTKLAQGDNGIDNATVYKNSAYRFITEQNKKGLFVISEFKNIGVDKYAITLEVKIEK